MDKSEEKLEFIKESHRFNEYYLEMIRAKGKWEYPEDTIELKRYYDDELERYYR